MIAMHYFLYQWSWQLTSPTAVAGGRSNLFSVAGILVMTTGIWCALSLHVTLVAGAVPTRFERRANLLLFGAFLLGTIAGFYFDSKAIRSYPGGDQIWLAPLWMTLLIAAGIAFMCAFCLAGRDWRRNSLLDRTAN